MVHSMIEKVIFYLEEQWYKSCLAEAAEAVRSYAQYGFKTDLLVIEAGEGIPEPEYSALYLADSKRLLQMLSDRGAAFCAYSKCSLSRAWRYTFCITCGVLHPPARST